MKCVANMWNIKKTSLWLLGLLVTCASCSDPKEFEYNDDDYNTEEKVIVNVTDPSGEEETLTAGTKMYFCSSSCLPLTKRIDDN